MPVDHSLALQTALVSAIAADGDLTALISDRIYDFVPADPIFPFCRLGPMATAPFEGDCIDGNEIRLTVHGFTKDYGRASASDLAAALVNLLGRTTLDLGNGIFADVRAAGWTVLEDTGEKGAWHASVNLIATTTA